MPVSRRLGNTDYETLNTHEIVTREKNPKLVRSWSGPGTEEVGRLYR